MFIYIYIYIVASESKGLRGATYNICIKVCLHMHTQIFNHIRLQFSCCLFINGQWKISTILFMYCYFNSFVTYKITFYIFVIANKHASKEVNVKLHFTKSTDTFKQECTISLYTEDHPDFRTDKAFLSIL